LPAGHQSACALAAALRSQCSFYYLAAFFAGILGASFVRDFFMRVCA